MGPLRSRTRASLAALMGAVLSLGCAPDNGTSAAPSGSVEPTEPRPPGNAALPSEELPSPPLPAPDGDADTQPHTDAIAPVGPPQLVVLHAHPLLRSEERYVERVRGALSGSSVPLERTDAGPRAGALEAWLGESDPTARAAMPLGDLRGGARAVLVLRLAEPDRGRAGGVVGFGVIAGQPARERLWATSDLPIDAAGDLAVLLTEEGS